MTEQEFNNKFPNGFPSWQETHFEIVRYLISTEDIEDTISGKRRVEQGIGGLYEIAEELTDQFENSHIGVGWDGDFFDSLDAFLESKEKGEI
jgi:hypothetical protein